MKVVQIVLLAAVTLQISTSYGASKKQLREQAALMQEQLNTVQEQQLQEDREAEMATPTRTSRKLDPCEEMALMESENYLAAGMAIAATESEAKKGAMDDARSQLAQMIRVVVNNAPEGSSDAQRNQFVTQSLESTRPIKWSIYDLSNGKVQVYVCMEMTKSPATFTASNYGVGAATTPIAAPVAGGISIPAAAVNPDAEALCEQGREDCLRNRYSAGIPKLMQAVEMGSVTAQYYVGLLYLYGDNVTKDTKIAFQYMLSAAQNGHKEATFEVAELYNSGTGVTKNKDQAREWYERSKALGDTRAESRLRRL
ncbi:MAG: tetratricopeptide repeat protein [Rikenellaceae bacterium]